jgi:tetratricopeptide (TPR) repeat protein
MRALVLLFVTFATLPAGRGADGDRLVQEALAAEQRFEIPRALDLLLQAERAGRGDAFTLQRIARQYSDLVTEQPDRPAQRRYAELALDYSRRAAALEPTNAVNALSIAISYGKLAWVSDTRDKVRYSRLVRSETERALALDPNYAWAHHILGRWHFEIARLGIAARAVVALVYGGLPGASVEEGVKHLERALALEPDELQHHIEVGLAYRARGETERARSALERGLALQPRAKIDLEAQKRAREALAALAAR